MTVTSSWHCAECGWTSVELQVPNDLPLRDVAVEIASIEFEGQVLHDLLEHLVDLLTAASEMTHLAAVLARPSVLLVCGDDRLYCQDGAE